MSCLVKYIAFSTTGLDTAAPLFEHEDNEVRLDKSDAEFVDGIHTNTQRVAIATGIGMAKEVGHIDFYVNGGSRQPGCLDLSNGKQFKRNDIVKTLIS